VLNDEHHGKSTRSINSSGQVDVTDSSPLDKSGLNTVSNTKVNRTESPKEAMVPAVDTQEELDEKMIQETLAELSKSKSKESDFPPSAEPAPKIIGQEQFPVVPTAMKSKKGFFNEIALKELRFVNLAVTASQTPNLGHNNFNKTA
jgi:hypothetical protein